MAELQMFLHRKDELLTFVQSFKAIPVEDHTEVVLESKLVDLERRWEKYEEAYTAFMVTPTNDADEKKEKQSAKESSIKCTESYHECHGSMLELLQTFTKRPTAPSLDSTHIGGSDGNRSLIGFTNTASGFSVAACETEDFHGSYEEWPAFRDLFFAIYINNPRLTAAQKLFHLRQKTKGKAGKIVKQFALCDENFQLAWDALRSRFENKRVIVDNQLKTLLSLPTATSETNEAISKVQTAITDCLAILGTQKVKTENWDPFLVYLCSSKLPEETLALWEQSLDSHKDLPTWRDMEDFLISRCEVLERVNSIKGSKPKSGSAAKNFSFSKQGSNSQ